MTNNPFADLGSKWSPRWQVWRHQKAIAQSYSSDKPCILSSALTAVVKMLSLSE